MMVTICAILFEIFNKVKKLWRTYNIDLGDSNLDVELGRLCHGDDHLCQVILKTLNCK
jgi:hypothetical protein